MDERRVRYGVTHLTAAAGEDPVASEYGALPRQRVDRGADGEFLEAFHHHAWPDFSPRHHHWPSHRRAVRTAARAMRPSVLDHEHSAARTSCADRLRRHASASGSRPWSSSPHEHAGQELSLRIPELAAQLT